MLHTSTDDVLLPFYYSQSHMQNKFEYFQQDDAMPHTARNSHADVAGSVVNKTVNHGS